MTRIEFCEDGHALTGMELGFVSEARFATYIRYKVFRDLQNQGHDKSTAITLAADRMGCEDSTIYRAIQFMENVACSG